MRAWLREIVVIGKSNRDHVIFRIRASCRRLARSWYFALSTFGVAEMSSPAMFGDVKIILCILLIFAELV